MMPRKLQETRMSLFQNHRSYWVFVSEVKRHYRYAYTNNTRQFLSSFLQIAPQSEAIINNGAILYRSQRGHSYQPLTDKEGSAFDEVPCPFTAERMKPLPDKAREGRINPRGIPHLYMSNDKETALAESRPWSRELVSLGYFKINRKLKLVHFTQEKKATKVYLATPPGEEVDSLVWEDINQAFSRPIIRNESAVDYIPTQVLAEAIKSEGYDGIVYKSSLGKGLNIALFDPSLAELVKCSLFEVRKIDYGFEEAASPYYVTQKLNRGIISANKT